MASNDDVLEMVQEAVRQFAEGIGKTPVAVLPTIALSDAPPKIKAVVMETSPKLAHETARRLAGKSVVCVETWDGYATVGGVRTDAVLVNYWVEGRGPVFFVQRYKRDPFAWVGGAISGEDAVRLSS